MTNYPVRGESPWDTDLKAYIDSGPAIAPLTAASGTAEPGTGVVSASVISGVAPFLDWLGANSVSGAISEFGIPVNGDQDRWGQAAEGWFNMLDDLGIPVLQWTDSGGFAVFPGMSASSGPSGLDSSAAPVVRHASRGLRGFMASSAPNTVPPADFCNVNNTPGNLWTPPVSAYPVIAATGAKIVRINTRWETIQPTLLGALNATEVNRLKAAIAGAHAAGLQVVLDLHNYGEYRVGPSTGVTVHRLGDGTLTQAHLVDVWTRMAMAFNGLAGLHAYEVMNEPYNLSGSGHTTTTTGTGTLARGAVIAVTSGAVFPSSGTFGVMMGGDSKIFSVTRSGNNLTVVDIALGDGTTWAAAATISSPQKDWETYSQAAVTAIRTADTATEVWVSGYYYQKAQYWPVNHPAAWITDTANHLKYVAHDYWSFGATDSGYEDWASEVALRFWGGPAGYFALPGGTYPNIEGTAENLPIQGEGIYADELVSSRSQPNKTSAPSSGALLATCFLAGTSGPITKVELSCDTGWSGTAPTLIKVGVYEMKPDRSAVLVASSANVAGVAVPVPHMDGSFGSVSALSTFNLYQIPLSAPWHKQAGKFYAVVVQVVSTGTRPQLVGTAALGGTTHWPYPCWKVDTGLTDLPTHLAPGDLSQGYDLFYAALLH